MTIKKPTFPTVSPQQFTKPLDKISTAVGDAQKPDGSVDVKDLRDAVKGDPLAKKNLNVVLDQFEETVSASDGRPPEHLNPRAVYPGCAGTVTSYTVDAQTLDKGQVSNVMDLLMKVKGAAEGIDANNDGVVSQKEYAAAAQDAHVGSGAYTNKKILFSLIQEASPEIAAFFDADTTHRAARENASMRPGVARQISDRADHHAATPEAADALKWTYNEKIVDRPRHYPPLSEQLDKAAESAETSLWRFMPFSNVMRQSSHLNNNEVREMLNVPENMSLTDFTNEVRDRVVAKAGGDWEGFLAGNDVE